MTLIINIFRYAKKIVTKRANCECKIKIKFPFLTKINIDKKELLNNFKDFDKNSNLFVVK